MIILNHVGGPSVITSVLIRAKDEAEESVSKQRHMRQTQLAIAEFTDGSRP